MIQNIFHRKSRESGDSGTFSAQKKTRHLPVSNDLLFFVVGVIGLIVLYFVLRGWYSGSEGQLKTATEQYDQVYVDIRTDDFYQATFFVSKTHALVDILNSSTSFIPVVERFTESIHQDVVLETINVDIENNQVKIGIKANAHNVSSLGQQYLAWRDTSPWIVDITLDSMTVDNETQIVDFTANILVDMSLLEGEQPDTESEN